MEIESPRELGPIDEGAVQFEAEGRCGQHESGKLIERHPLPVDCYQILPLRRSAGFAGRRLSRDTRAVIRGSAPPFQKRLQFETSLGYSKRVNRDLSCFAMDLQLE